MESSSGGKYKIYLAGPMRGIKEFNFPEFFNATEQLREHYFVCNPAERDQDEADFEWRGTTGNEDLSELGLSLREALAYDVAFIAEQADGIVLLKGWENSSGARAELALAQALGLDVWHIASKDGELLKLHGFGAGELHRMVSSALDTIATRDRELWKQATFGQHYGANPPCPKVWGKEGRMSIKDPSTQSRPVSQFLGQELIAGSKLPDILDETWLKAAEGYGLITSGVHDEILMSFQDPIEPREPWDTPDTDSMPTLHGTVDLAEKRVTSSTGGEKGEKHLTYSNFPPGIMALLMEHYYDGSQKYKTDETGLPNYCRGFNYSLSINALMRHWQAWLDGETSIPDDGTDDPTIGNHHLVAVAWQALALLFWDTTSGYEEFDDRASTAIRKWRTKQDL